MADTLAEIYRNTLTASDFDSNGELRLLQQTVVLLM